MQHSPIAELNHRDRGLPGLEGPTVVRVRLHPLQSYISFEPDAGMGKVSGDIWRTNLTTGLFTGAGYVTRFNPEHQPIDPGTLLGQTLRLGHELMGQAGAFEVMVRRHEQGGLGFELSVDGMYRIDQKTGAGANFVPILVRAFLLAFPQATLTFEHTETRVRLWTNIQERVATQLGRPAAL
jgi:hypothetical protein